MSTNKRKKKKKDPEAERLPWIIVSIVVAVLVFFALSGIGRFGIYTGNLFSWLFGFLYFVPLISLCLYGIYVVFLRKKYPQSGKVLAGCIILNLAIVMLSGIIANNVHTFAQLLDYIKDSFLGIPDENFLFGAGILGNFLNVVFESLFSRVGAIIVLVVLFVIAALLIVPFSVYQQMGITIKEKHEVHKQERAERREVEKEEKRLRRERLMEEEAAAAAKRSQEFTIIDDIERPEVPETAPESAPVEEVKIEIKKPDHSDVLSTKSKYFINLEEHEVNAPQESKPLEQEDILNAEPTVEMIEPEEKKAEEAPEEKRVLPKENNTPVRKKNGAYRYPPIDILEKPTSQSSNINRTSAQVKGEKIIEILNNFDIQAELVDTHIGPSVTKFEVRPDSSVKVDRIMNISNNIKMELAAKEIRIEAPIPGKNAVGIEVPNVEPIPVKMYELMRSMPKNSAKLSFALGKDLMGNSVYCDLAKMPHLLIAGATGSGKSVCINTIITSFLYRAHPDELKLVLVDPKKVEFTPYHDIPHLLWPVITDTTMACNMLGKLTVIMEQRYDIFAEAGVRNIQGYNEYVADHNTHLKEGEEKISKMPYIVIIIDELADLMAIARKDVQLYIQRITQLARACGMHLIVATQRPSVDVITGVIKSNIPSRISFAVASQTDSRTILDKVGAERLLGNGDMLYLPQGESTPIRLQGSFVNDKEVKAVTTFVKSQASPTYEDSYFEFLNNMNGTIAGNAQSVHANESDGLYEEVVEYVKEAQKASTSLLQRRFGIGYNRAARLIDTLEDRGIIGPAQGSKPREVYVKKEESEE